MSRRNPTLPCGRQRPPSKHIPNGVQRASQKDHLKTYLKEQGLKFTGPRWSIVETILEIGVHFDAGTLVDLIQKRHSHIGTATVYRTLKVLREAGILEVTQTSPEGPWLYEFRGDEHHDHILCLDCREIFEFHDEPIEKRQHDLAEQRSFRVIGHHHVIQARCQLLKRR